MTTATLATTAATAKRTKTLKPILPRVSTLQTYQQRTNRSAWQQPSTVLTVTPVKVSSYNTSIIWPGIALFHLKILKEQVWLTAPDLSSLEDGTWRTPRGSHCSQFALLAPFDTLSTLALSFSNGQVAAQVKDIRTDHNVLLKHLGVPHSGPDPQGPNHCSP
jgi:hypothetical protein